MMKSAILFQSLASLLVCFFMGCRPIASDIDRSINAEIRNPAVGTIQDGERLIVESDFRGAADLFSRIVAQSPDLAEAHYYLGFSKRNLGEIETAIVHYEKALELNHYLLEAHINLGLLLLEKGDLQRAKNELSFHLAVSPNEMDANYNYALLLEEMGDLQGAKKYYTRAIELDPLCSDAIIGLADIEEKNGNAEEARELYKKAEELKSNKSLSAF